MRFFSLACFLFVSQALLCAEAADIPIRAVAAGVDRDRRFEIFGIGADGNAYQRWQMTGTSAWSDWIENAPGQYTDIQTLPVSGRIFLIGLDAGVLTVRMQAAPGSSWNTESFRSGHGLTRMAAAVNSDGHVEIVALGGDGKLWALHSLSASPTFASADWSGWTDIGEGSFQELALGHDGDGRLIAATLTSNGSVYVTQTVNLTSDDHWLAWDLMPATNMRGIQLVCGKSSVLWLLAVDNHGALNGRTLARTGTSPIATSPELIKNILSPPHITHPPPTGASRTTVKGTVGPLALARPRLWSDWVPLSQPSLIFLNELSVSIDKAGIGEIAGIANNTSIVTMVQNPDGTWPDTWSVLPGDSRITEFTSLSLATNFAGETRIFVTDRASGKVFSIGKVSDAEWSSVTWTSLGKYPGADEPDLIFAVAACLDGLVGDPSLTAAQQQQKVADLRQSIADGIPAKIATAISDTPLVGLIGNVNASSRCTSHGETLAVWLNHEVWPGAYEEDPHIPAGNAFVYRIPAATLTNIMNSQIKEALKTIKDFEVDHYSIQLKAPNQLEIDLDGKVLKMAVSAKAVATFSTANGVPTCTADLTASRPEGLYAIAGTFFIPANALGALVQFGNIYESDPVDKANDKIQLVCKLTDALLSNLFIPRKDLKTEPLRELKVPYTSLTVDSTLGIVGSGGVPTLAAPNPQVTLFGVPVGPTAYTNATFVNVAFFARPTDMNPPLVYTWTPDNSSSLRLANNPGLGGDLSGDAFYVFGIAPNPSPTTYDLGNMHVVVTDAEGQTAQATKDISLGTVQNTQ
jgi:hypothetical protein